MEADRAPLLGQREGKKKSAPARALLVALGILHVVLGSGEVYGWTALRPLLLQAGFFEAESDQSHQLAIVATLGITGNVLCKGPLFLSLDRYGPRANGVIGSLMMISGSLLLAYGDRNSTLCVGSGYFLLGVSGPFIQTPCFQLSNLFPALQGPIMTVFVASFELSTGVFLVFNQICLRAGASFSTLFAAYAGIGGFLLLSGLMFWPDRPYSPQAPFEAEADEIHPHHPAAVQLNQRQRVECPDDTAPQVAKIPLAFQPLGQQLLSSEFGFAAAFMSVHVFRQGFVLTTMAPQLLNAFSDPDLATELSDVFSLCLALGFIPIFLASVTGCGEYLLCRPVLSLLVSTAVSMAYSVLFLWNSSVSYLAIFILLPTARQLAYSTFFTWSVSVFGYASFRDITAVACSIAGLLQLLLQPAVIYAVEESPSTAPVFSWGGVNICLAAAPGLLVVLFFARCYASQRSCEDHKFPAQGPDILVETSGDSSTPLGIPRMPTERMQRATGAPTRNASLLFNPSVPADIMTRYGSWTSWKDSAGSSLLSHPASGSLSGHFLQQQAETHTSALYADYCSS